MKLVPVSYFCLTLSVLTFCGIATLGATPRAMVFPPTHGEYLILPDEVIDGDTIRFYYLVEGTARLYGINTPEVYGSEKELGLAAKKFLESNLPKVPVKAVFMGREKFGRALVSLHNEDGKNLGQLMIDSGHAKSYLGKGPMPRFEGKEK